MKLSMILLSALVTGTAFSAAEKTTQDSKVVQVERKLSTEYSVKEQPPRVGTPEKTAVDFLHLVLADKKDEAMKLCTKKQQEQHAKYKGFMYTSMAKCLKEFQYDKKFTYLIKDENETDARVYLAMKTEDGTPTGRFFNLKKVDGKWLIDKM